ncbi:MAG: LytTR family DNA-binding domain-containing protein [Bacteroides sp.]|nr:LytTR family DNA-binding domain-containing protein [Bacteroides sp.]
MKCIAIDDEPVALSILAQYCQRMGDIELRTYSDPVVGMQEVNRTKPELLFLDIRMGEISGVELARDIPRGTFLVFTTAYSEYAVDGFDLNAVDFLHKPFSFSRFSRAVEKARQLRALTEMARKPVMGDEEITVKVEYRNVKVPLASVVYIEAMDNYVRIHLTDARPVLSQISLKSLLEQLPDEFVRIHKSYIVPLYRIASYTRTELTLYHADTVLPIGRAYYTDFVSRMTNK